MMEAAVDEGEIRFTVSRMERNCAVVFGAPYRAPKADPSSVFAPIRSGTLTKFPWESWTEGYVVTKSPSTLGEKGKTKRFLGIFRALLISAKERARRQERVASGIEFR